MIPIPSIAATLHALQNKNTEPDYEPRPNEKIKVYKYRLTLEIYEEEPLNTPNAKYAIDTLSVFKEKEYVAEILKNSFEKILEAFNRGDTKC